MAYIHSAYAADGGVSAFKISAHFEDEDDSTQCARILSLDNRTDNAEKAYADYIKIISVEMQRQLAKNLAESGNADLDMLNRVLKKKN